MSKYWKIPYSDAGSMADVVASRGVRTNAGLRATAAAAKTANTQSAAIVARPIRRQLLPSRENHGRVDAADAITYQRVCAAASPQSQRPDRLFRRADRPSESCL